MKKRWSVLLVFTIFLIVLIGIVACFFKKDNKPKVIVVAQRLDLEYWKLFELGAKAAFRDFDIDGKVLAPSSIYPASNQSNMLKKVLTQQPDALVVTPIDPSVTIPELVEYNKNDIPVIVAYKDIEWESKTAYIGTDNYELGKTAGELLGSMLQPGNQVAIIFGGSDDQIMIDRKNGAKKVLEDTGLEIVAEQSVYDRFGNLTPVIGTILEAYPNIKGVVATSDRLALQVLKQMEEKGLKIPVIGADGVKEMVEDIKVGKIDTAIAQNPYDMAYLSVEQATKAIRGDDVQKKVDIGVDLITKDNVEERLNFLNKISRE
ncbi:sugar ABC transporter substrate-binding protein [Bacillus sp. OTU530]|uniref:sugar ABC transporter substrate-binding protein n=1 Tax=Bacillus sp. OTU530 TaxID=3043862 RepID=UPI00313E3A08